MNKEILENLLKDPDFTQKLNSAASEEEILNAFSEYGFDISFDELKEFFVKSNSELPDSELSAVSGGIKVTEGITCILLGIGADAGLENCAIIGAGFICVIYGIVG